MKLAIPREISEHSRRFSHQIVAAGVLYASLSIPPIEQVFAIIYP
jgi:hypothetical protein